MEFKKFVGLVLLLLMGFHKTVVTENQEKNTALNQIQFNPLPNTLLDQNKSDGDVHHENNRTNKMSLLRVKRQGYYDPYYYRRDPYYPLPIFIGLGGGVFGPGGFGGFGGRGFGGRGFGGRGFGGFGGRGFGGIGRGFGGRGFGGFGGRGFGGFGGGRGRG